MNLRKYFLIGVLNITLASITTGCSLFGGEEDTIEVSPSPVTETAFPLSRIWNNTLPGNTKIYSLLSPAVRENTVYAAGRNGQVKAIDLTTGSTLWHIDLAESSLFHSKSALLSGGVSVDGKSVYLGSERASVYTIDKHTGTVIWQKEVKGEVLAKPVSAERRLIIHTTNGYLQVLDQETGNEIWQINMDVPTLSLRGESTPAIARNLIIVGDNNGHVNAYSTKDGQLVWRQQISQPSGSTEIAKLNDVDSSPLIEQGLVYAVGYNGNIVALDLNNGQTVWKRALGSTHSFTVNKDRIFVVDQDDHISALSKNNSGVVIWKQSDLLHRQLTDPVIYQNYIVVGDFEGYLYLIDISNGNIISKTKVSNSGLLAKPIVVDNKIIIQAKNGNVYAYEQR